MDKKTWIIILLLAVIVVILIVLFNQFFKTGDVVREIDGQNKITLSQDNFVFVDYSYLNSHLHQDFCEKRKTKESCRHTQDADPDSPIVKEQCPKKDILNLHIKMVDLDDYYTQVYCKIYDNSNLIRDEYRDSYQPAGPTSADIGDMLIFLDYMSSHELLVCCKVGRYDGSSLINSNEVCLPKIKINTIC